MVWDLAQWGCDRDGTRVRNLRNPSGPHLTCRLKPGSSNEQRWSHTVQDLGTRSGQGRKPCLTAILVLWTCGGFHPHPPL